MTEPRPGEVWRAKSNPLLLVEVLGVTDGPQPTVTICQVDRPSGHLPVNQAWFLGNFERDRGDG